MSDELDKLLARRALIDSTVGKPMLVGEAPSARGDEYHRYPLSGPPSRVLCCLAGIEPDERGTTYGRWYWPLRERFLATNLIERYADAEPWSAPRARERAALILPQLPRVVVLLGQKVTNGFCTSELPLFTPCKYDVGDAIRWVVIIPHPSGLNRLYNDPEQRARVGDCLRWAMAEASR